MTEHDDEGSSPLTRGKLGCIGPPRGRERLIPAHAGKTDIVAQFASTMRAHPRSRGENHRSDRDAVNGIGSSPLTRGKPRAHAANDRQPRLIPAHAGKTTDVSSARHSPAAHPRSRGENAFESAGGGQGIGSSPLTRGKPHLPPIGCKIERLIPAHAGKTALSSLKLLFTSAHPRSRGENPPHRLAFHRSAGSSPLTRGKQATGLHVVAHDGLIPAHAGKT